MLGCEFYEKRQNLNMNLFTSKNSEHVGLSRASLHFSCLTSFNLICLAK